jgi:hypothetical protein
MFVISSETELFGNHPEWPTSSTNPEFRSEFAEHWKLEPVSNAQAPPPEPERPGQPHRPRTEIIRGSTGSRIFELLNRLKPSSTVRVSAQSDAKDDHASEPPKRKLPL